MKKVVKDVATEAGKTVSKVAAEVVKEAPKTAKKVSTEAKKVTAEAKKAVTQKSATKKTAVKETVYLQYLGKEINKDELTAQVKEIWTKQLKKKVSELKSITLYIKPEENRVYYVINDTETGSIAL
jgi:hypothetical protein